MKIHLPMIQIMIGTACRVGEICGLTWADVEYEGQDHQYHAPDEL